MFHICINHLIHDTLTIEAEFELKGRNYNAYWKKRIRKI